MSLIVQKFGGTSLATEESRESVTDKILEASKKYDEVVVVVSAMGRRGAPYATDTLLSLLENEGHYINNRELDMLIACGEMITAVIISNSLKAKGGQSEALTGGKSGIITSSDFTRAEVLELDVVYLKSILDKKYIPVIAGFQGQDLMGNTTTLGRGGSDTSAALIGEALGADVVEIYTDVDGIMTADPNVCSKAQTINSISYLEVFQMADSGAKVIHPRAVEVARRSGIPMVIRNTFNDLEGTSITHYNQMNKKITINDKLITSIAHRDNRIQFMVLGNLDDEVFFQELADEGISIDIINIFPNQRIFTTESINKQKTINLIEFYKVRYSYIDNCCKITVIGERMTGVPGVMARIIKSLTSVNVKILQTADSLSTIACLVSSKDLEKSVYALHKTFGLHE